MKYFEQRNNSDHLVVLFHGTGGNEYQMLPIAGTLFPDADIVSFEGAVGPGRYFPALTNGKIDRPAFNKAVDAFMQQWNTLNLVYKKITLIGYSNGANFAIGLLEKGIAVNTAYLLHPADLDYDISKGHRETQIIITTGANDYMVPPGDAKQLEKQFKNIYSDVTFMLLDGGHEISDEELKRLKQLGNA